MTHPRQRGERGTRKHVVSYHHVIHSLKRKPQAFAGLSYRDQLFPREAYRQAWDALWAALPHKEACRYMVALLVMAHEDACEGELARLIDAELKVGRLPEAARLRRRLRPDTSMPTDVPVHLTDPHQFDALLTHRREVA